MVTKLLGLIACVALLGSNVAANASIYIVTLEEVGPNVVAMGSGSIDLTGLASTGPTSGDTGVIPSAGLIFTGGSPTGTDVIGWTGSILGPPIFGPGGTLNATSGTGDMVGLFESFTTLFVPVTYVSDSALTDGAIYDTATFASLSVTPGTYVWTWGTGADQSFTLFIVSPLEIGATPLPAALPLFATGLSGLGLFGWCRKRKNAAAIAAA